MSSSVVSPSKKGRDFEKVVAKVINGRLIPNSGAGAFKKGDVVNSTFLLDTKYTDSESYIFNLDTFDTLEVQATQLDKLPAIAIGFGNHKRFAIIDLELLNDLSEYLESL